MMGVGNRAINFALLNAVVFLLGYLHICWKPGGKDARTVETLINCPFVYSKTMPNIKIFIYYNFI
jgi:hypothetical protein